MRRSDDADLLNEQAASFFRLGKYQQAHRSWLRSARIRFGTRGGRSVNPALPIAPSLCCITKLDHDLEQYRYLTARGIFGREVRIPLLAYEKLRELASRTMKRDQLFAIPPRYLEKMSPLYNRLNHTFLPKETDRPAINPDLDFRGIEESFLKTGVAVFDDFLRPSALLRLRRLCLESTFWFDSRGWFLGAYLQRGLSCGLLFQVARELKTQLPRTLAKAPLRQIWSYKYDSEMPGIPPHADEAAINMNFWITPDSANLNRNHGGLIIYPEPAPADWSFREFNRDTKKILAYLRSKKVRPIIIPYRQNRCVIFDSRLFHATDEFQFAEGYENRRINMTLLFGDRPNISAF